MTQSSDIKAAWAYLMKLTNDPLAPIHLQNTYAQADKLGQCLAGCANQAQAQAIKDRLLSDFEDPELDDLTATPEFIIAVASLLCGALQAMAGAAITKR